jgi:hypothetical protein
MQQQCFWLCTLQFVASFIAVLPLDAACSVLPLDAACSVMPFCRYATTEERHNNVVLPLLHTGRTEHAAYRKNGRTTLHAAYRQNGLTTLHAAYRQNNNSLRHCKHSFFFFISCLIACSLFL